MLECACGRCFRLSSLCFGPGSRCSSSAYLSHPVTPQNVGRYSTHPPEALLLVSCSSLLQERCLWSVALQLRGEPCRSPWLPAVPHWPRSVGIIGLTGQRSCCQPPSSSRAPNQARTTHSFHCFQVSPVASCCVLDIGL